MFVPVMKPFSPAFRILLLVASLLGTAGTVSAQRMRDVFAAMPDSIFPFLSKNNRLDCIDFIENNMKAHVKGTFDEPVELIALTDDYLVLAASAAERVEMKMLPVPDSSYYVALVRTYLGPVGESTVEFYTPDWQSLPQAKQLVLPCYEDFFVPNDSLPHVRLDELRGFFTLRLVQAVLAPSAHSLTFTLSLDELPEEMRAEVRPFVRPLVYRWDIPTRRFVRE